MHILLCSVSLTPQQATVNPRICWRLLDTHGQVCSFWRLFLSSGSWSAKGFVCALQESVSPVLQKFYNQIPLASKVRFPRGSQSLCQIPRLGNLLLVLCLVAQLCPTLCDPMDCSPPGSFVHGDSLGKNTGVGCHALL